MSDEVSEMTASLCWRYMDVDEISQFQVAVFMFKFSIGQLPTKFSSYFIRTTSIHQYSTRSSLYGYVIPFVRTSVAKRNIKYLGPLTWNNLPQDIRNSYSFATFKVSLKRYFINSKPN